MNKDFRIILIMQDDDGNQFYPLVSPVEYIGIPTVTVAGKTFVSQVHSTGVNRGVPVLRTAEYPGAFASDSREVLQKNVRDILWPQMKMH